MTFASLVFALQKWGEYTEHPDPERELEMTRVRRKWKTKPDWCWVLN